MGNSHLPDDFQELSPTGKMNPLQIAAHFWSSDALPLLLRYVQIIWETISKDRTKITNLIHSKADLEEKKSSLMLDIMTNKYLIKSGNLLIVFEDLIHKSDSIKIEECVFQYMASSKASKDTVKQIKNIHPKDKKDCWPITKFFFEIMVFQQLLKLFPSVLDTVFDILALREYHNSTITNHTNNNGTHTNTTDVLILTHSKSHNGSHSQDFSTPDSGKDVSKLGAVFL